MLTLLWGHPARPLLPPAAARAHLEVSWGLLVLHNVRGRARQGKASGAGPRYGRGSSAAQAGHTGAGARMLGGRIGGDDTEGLSCLHSARPYRPAPCAGQHPAQPVLGMGL